MCRRRCILALIGALSALASAPAAGHAEGIVREVVLDRAIDPVTERFVVGEIEDAGAAGARAVVLRIDTPGGLDDSLRGIVRSMLSSRVPVIAYVAPDGARAASAGVFVVYASDLAAMAPQTNIGSSTPVVAGGGDIPEGDLRNKVINDAVARIRTLADEHDRNADWAEQAVREAANVSAREALELGVVELIATDIDDLLRQAHGRTTVPRGFVLDLDDVTVETRELPLHLEIVDTLLDPTILSLMLLLGIGLIALEFATPGTFLPGAVGAVLVILSLFGITVLPFTWAGLLLLIGGAALMIAEVHVGHGALGVTGVIAFTAGALLVFDSDQLAVSLPILLAVAAVLAVVLLLVVRRTAAARRLPSATGVERLVGRRAEVRERLDPDGLVFVHGELWHAVADAGPVPAGAEVVVDRLEGLTLHVHHVPPAAEEAAP